MKPMRSCPSSSRCSTAARTPPALSSRIVSASILPGRAVDEDDRHAVGDVGQQVAVVGRRRRDDQPVDAALEQLADEVALLLGILVRAARDQQHVAAAQHLLDAARDRGVEGVADVADDEAERARRVALAQRARRVVAPEAELEDRGLHALLGLGTHVRLAVDDARDRLQADLAPRGRRRSSWGGSACALYLDRRSGA